MRSTGVAHGDSQRATDHRAEFGEGALHGAADEAFGERAHLETLDGIGDGRAVDGVQEFELLVGHVVRGGHSAPALVGSAEVAGGRLAGQATRCHRPPDVMAVALEQHAALTDSAHRTEPGDRRAVGAQYPQVGVDGDGALGDREHAEHRSHRDEWRTKGRRGHGLVRLSGSTPIAAASAASSGARVMKSGRPRE